MVDIYLRYLQVIKFGKKHNEGSASVVVCNKKTLCTRRMHALLVMQHSGGGDPSLLLRLVQTCLVFELFVRETNSKKNT